MLRPLAETLRTAALDFLSGQLEAVVLADTEGLTWLPTPCLLDLLAHPALVRNPVPMRTQVGLRLILRERVDDTG